MSMEQTKIIDTFGTYHTPPPREAAHSAGADHEFLVDLCSLPRSRLRLPDAFAELVAEKKPSGLWLQLDGCPNGPSWVEVGYPLPRAMDLEKGWKSFARSQDLGRGMHLMLRYDGKATVFVKIFGIFGERPKCCAESESGDSLSSYSGDDGSDDSSGDDVEELPAPIKCEALHLG